MTGGGEPARPPCGPDGWGEPAGWGPPAAGWGAGYAPPAAGWVGGFAPPGADAVVPPWVRRRRRAARLSTASLLLALGGFGVALAGAATFLLGGFLLLGVAALMAVVAFGLALLAVGYAVAARGGRVRGRVVAVVPAVFAVLAVGPVLGSLAAGLSGGEDRRTPAALPLPPAATPEQVTRTAARALAMGNAEQACVLLAEPARTPACPTVPALRRPFAAPARVTVLSADPARALVRYDAKGASPHRVRLVREPDGWRLLDLPGLPDDCVDTAEDPFRCAVRIH